MRHVIMNYLCISCKQVFGWVIWGRLFQIAFELQNGQLYSEDYLSSANVTYVNLSTLSLDSFLLSLKMCLKQCINWT